MEDQKLWGQRLWMQLPLLSALVSSANADAQRSPQVLVTHIGAKVTGLNNCVGTQIRYDQIETIGVAFSADDEAVQAQVNRVMNRICYSAYNTRTFLKEINEDERIAIDSRSRIINICEARFIDNIDRYGLIKSRVYRSQMFNYLSDIYLILTHVEKRAAAAALTNGAITLVQKGMMSGDDSDSSLAAEMIDDTRDATFDAIKDSATELLKKNM